MKNRKIDYYKEVVYYAVEKKEIDVSNMSFILRDITFFQYNEDGLKSATETYNYYCDILENNQSISLIEYHYDDISNDFNIHEYFHRWSEYRVLIENEVY